MKRVARFIGVNMSRILQGTLAAASYTQGSFDELRYIDDVAFSTTRIGQ